MRLLRGIGNAILWGLAVVGLLSGLVWGAQRAGVAQPIVVVSGSMSPGIGVGALLISVPTPIETVEPGSIATLRSAHTGHYVTHRVVQVEDLVDHYTVSMKGDANDVVDDEMYFVGAGQEVLQPRLVIPHVGVVATVISSPRVAVPAVIAIAALIALSAIPRPRGRHEMVDEPSRFRESRRRERAAA